MNKELTPLEAFNELEKDNWFIDIYKYAYLNPANKEKLHIIENALKDFEWLKSKLDIDFMNRLSVPEDKIRLLKIMGLEIEFNE